MYEQRIVYAIEMDSFAEAQSACVQYAQAVEVVPNRDGSFMANGVIIDWSCETGWSDKAEIEFVGGVNDVERIFTDFKYHTGIEKTPEVGTWFTAEKMEYGML